MGGVLEQWVNGKWVPLGFFSKGLKSSQQAYSTFKRELLAVHLSIKHFLPEFWGRHIIIYSDHKSLLGSFKNHTTLQSKDQIALNWINDIAQYTTDIRYLPAKANAVGDFLSRPDDCPIGTAYLPPSYEVAAIESFIDKLTPKDIASAQTNCPAVNKHRLYSQSANFKDGNTAR